MTPALQRLLTALGDPTTLDFARFVQAIYESGYTGPYTIHNLNGRPQRIDLGAPIRLSIVEANGEGVDSGKPPRAG